MSGLARGRATLERERERERERVLEREWGESSSQIIAGVKLL